MTKRNTLSIAESAAEAKKMFDVALKEFKETYPARLIKVMHMALVNALPMSAAEPGFVTIRSENGSHKFHMTLPEDLTKTQMEWIDDDFGEFEYKLGKMIMKRKEDERLSILRENALLKLTVEERKVLGLCYVSCNNQ